MPARALIAQGLAQLRVWSWLLRPARLFSGLHAQPLYRGMLLDWALPAIAPGQHVLELGCATGELAKALSLHGARVMGVDRSAAMVAQARRNAPGIRFERTDAMRLDPPDTGFDHVLAASLLNLVDDRPALLRAMARQLRSGGRMAVLVPDAAFDRPALERLLALHPHSSALEQAALRTWHRMAPKLSVRDLHAAGALAGLPAPALRPLLGGMVLCAAWQVS